MNKGQMKEKWTHPGKGFTSSPSEPVSTGNSSRGQFDTALHSLQILFSYHLHFRLIFLERDLGPFPLVLSCAPALLLKKTEKQKTKLYRSVDLQLTLRTTYSASRATSEVFTNTISFILILTIKYGGGRMVFLPCFYFYQSLRNSIGLYVKNEYGYNA